MHYSISPHRIQSIIHLYGTGNQTTRYGWIGNPGLPTRSVSLFQQDTRENITLGSSALGPVISSVLAKSSRSCVRSCVERSLEVVAPPPLAVLSSTGNLLKTLIQVGAHAIVDV